MSKSRDAYVFVLTLAVIAGLSLILAGAWYLQQSLSRNLNQLVDATHLEQDMRSATDVALYGLLTEPIFDNRLRVGGRLNPDVLVGGLLEDGDIVSLRGDPYTLEINGRTLIVRVVAMSGLVPLDPSRPDIGRLALEALGTPSPEAARMVAQFLDYVDPDQLRRLNGAEAPAYDGLPPIKDAPIALASEACGVLTWRETTICEDRRRLDLLFSPDIGGANDPASVPDYLLGELGLDERQLEQALERLASFEIASYEELSLEGWDSLIDRELLGYSSSDNRFIIIIHEPLAQLVLASRVDLTFGDVRQPFHRGFSHVLGGSWVEERFKIDGDPAELPTLPIALPGAD